MNTIVERFEKIKSNIALAKPLKPVEIIAVSKTFSIDHIRPLIEYGHNHFGENKVQEAVAKWSSHKKDNQKLADTLAKHQLNLNKKLKYFIQVNIGNEIQKSGVPVAELDAFYNYCMHEINLNVIGLMVLPPNDNNSEMYFKAISELSKSLAIKNLSMGMSSDYLNAVKYGSTFVRIGSSIFGSRS